MGLGFPREILLLELFFWFFVMLSLSTRVYLSACAIFLVASAPASMLGMVSSLTWFFREIDGNVLKLSNQWLEWRKQSLPFILEKYFVKSISRMEKKLPWFHEIFGKNYPKAKQSSVEKQKCKCFVKSICTKDLRRSWFDGIFVNIVIVHCVVRNIEIKVQ